MKNKSLFFLQLFLDFISPKKVAMHAVNGRADALLWRPDYDQGTCDNENVTVLPDSLFIWSLIIKEPLYEQKMSTIRKWTNAHWLKEFGGKWYKEGQLVITGDIAEWKRIVKEFHDPPMAGHPGIMWTKDLIARSYWWPRLQKDVEDYVKGCAQCQANKINTHAQKAPLFLVTTEAETRPFQTVAMDFITKLPLSDGHDTILTITDQGCTKMALFLPCSETITAEGVAHLYMQHVFKRFGLPTKIISNRDTHFMSRFAKDLCRHLGITQNISTAYHLRTDGQSEHTNQWLEQCLRFWTNHKQNNWMAYLPVAEFVHNTWYNATTKTSPFHLLMGYEPWATWEISKSSLPQITTCLDQMIEARQVAHEARRTAEASWEWQKHQQRFKEGNQVWLEGRNIHTSHPTTKLAPKQYGPFPITKILLWTQDSRETL